MNSEISIWAENEKKALDMAISKMCEIGAMTHYFKPRKRSGFNQDQINEMFEPYLNHFEKICHASDPAINIKRVLSKTLDNIEENFVISAKKK